MFGEHSVVHGRTAVAAALARRTTICVSAQQEREITTLMPAVSLPLAHFQLPANEQQISGLTLPEESLLNLPVLTKDATPQMLSRLAWWHEQVKDVTPSEARQSLLVLGFLHSALTERFCQGLKIEVSSQLTPGAGTGSSAAYSVALAAALMRFFRDADPGVADVETHAWKAEHLVHGTPSGLDTAVSARGGLVRFRARMVEAEPLPLCLLRVMLVDSGVARDTRRMHLIRTAQGLLVALGVSHPSLDKICSAAENRGLPAKLTGAGGGGNAFVLLLPSSGDFTALRSELLHELHCSSADEEQLFGPGVIIN
ncbi:hypothetical protein B566_EDAN012035 [Ephemera danica]|nr:hypothetical protein B566_EDAN012035 [Ephemera danica]